MIATAVPLGMLLLVDTQRLHELLDRLKLNAAAHQRLVEFHDLVRDDIPAIVDEFCDFVVSDPRIARDADGEAVNLHCLKHAVVAWLQSALSGSPRDEAFLAARRRIGKVHVQIDLPQETMFTAMSCIRTRLLTIALQRIKDAQSRDATLLALDRVLDLELALMLESYREHQQEQIKAHERLATIGQLAASIGHELRNPLGTIETSVYLMAQQLEKLGVNDDVAKRHVDKARKQVQLCSKIITDLLELARSRPPKRQIVNVDRLIDESLDALRLPESVTQKKQVAPNLTVMADPEQLRSVLVNLLENGRDAIGAAGTLAVEGFTSKNGIAIRVSDTGPGIPDDAKGRIFEPLFTTKAHGNGLGLALCRRIVTAHGGTIELDSVSQGASFLVWLPETAQPAADLSVPQLA
jgi:two-component system, NtrC family, sensor histidine kinase HydH